MEEKSFYINDVDDILKVNNYPGISLGIDSKYATIYFELINWEKIQSITFENGWVTVTEK